MDRNQGWPGEPPSQLASTSTHDLFGGQSGHSGMGSPPAGTSSLFGEGLDAVKKPARRNRNALSCAECRRLKLKCSRVWPCTSCIKRKCAHICPDDVLKEVRPSRNKEVGALHARIRELENALSGNSNHQGSNYGGGRTRPHSPTDASSSRHDDARSYASYEPYNTSGVGDSSHQPGIQDVAEVMGTLLLGDDGSSRYLGKSAANALFHEGGSDEDEASLGSDDEDELASNFSGRMNSTAFPMISRGLDVEDFQAMLPPMTEARHLSDAYWSNCAYKFEPLRRDIFELHFADAYNFSAEKPMPMEQLACVFMILALGVSFDLESEFRDPRSSKYHNIAQACLTSAKFLNVPSLASIQCLHLMSTWQLATHTQTGAFRAWPLLGLAGRMVLSTGIHRDGSIWAIPEPQLTLRRLLFWELASYDRSQGLILGRPYMLNSKHFDTLMPEGQGDSAGESIEYHRAKWQFSLLVGELCDECFSVGRPGYDTILLHDRKIRTFKENLPAWLRFDPQVEVAEQAPKAGSREFRQMSQRHSLQITIHETLLFLHRVAFANAIEAYPAEPLRSPWAQSVVSLCLEAARTLIGVTRSAVSNYPKLAGRWWNIQVHCFGAATCLAAVCIRAPASALTRLAWAELCDAVHLLESQHADSGHARDLAPRLKRLREQAQLKLDAYQQSIISSNYPPAGGASGGFEYEAHSKSGSSSHPHSGQTSAHGSGDGSNQHSEDKGGGEDEKLAVLGVATRVLEGRLRQPGRAHSSHHGSGHRPSPTSRSGPSSAGTYDNTPLSANSANASLTGTVSGAFGSSQGNSMFGAKAQNLQLQKPSHGMKQESNTPVFSASTPDAQSPPFSGGKNAMPVPIGFVDQSLADLLAEVSSPTQFSLGSGGREGSAAEDDSGMMYFNMPTSSDSGRTPAAEGSSGMADASQSTRQQDASGKSTGQAPYGDNGFGGRSDSTAMVDFKAPRNPNSAPATGYSKTTPVPSAYAALPDAAVSPSSVLTGYGGGPNYGLSGASANLAGGGQTFLSSIPGLMATSPGAYRGFTPLSDEDANRGGSCAPTGIDDKDSSAGAPTERGVPAPESRSILGDSSMQMNIGPSGRLLSNGASGPTGNTYLSTAWYDYFPTPGVGLFPQTTSLMYGGSSAPGASPGSTSGLATPQLSASDDGARLSQQQQQMQAQMQMQYQQAQAQAHAEAQLHRQQQQFQNMTGSNGGSFGQQQQQQQHMQQEGQHGHQQQQPLHPHAQYMQQPLQQPGPASAYRMYDDLFGSLTNNNSNRQY